MTDTQLRYAKTIIVPIARPDTAPHMLELATSLAQPDEGRIIALTVSVEGQRERAEETMEGCEPVVDEFIEAGYHVELIAQPAATITRGILDATREYGADLLILGVQQATHHDVKLGTLVENIIQAATCDVLVYRLGNTPDFDHVVVTLDGRRHNLNALRQAVAIARALKLPLSPMYIHRDYVYREDLEQDQNTLLVQHDTGSTLKEIVPGNRPEEHILKSLDEDDLLIMGFRQKSEFDSQLGNNLTRTLLNRAPGPVLLVSRLYEDNTRLDIVQRRLQRFNPALTGAERSELLWQAQKTALGGIDYLAMILLSALLASLGLLLNSVAVIIGAMLVAPLMSPLASLATGLVTSRYPVTQRALISLIEGIVLSLVISIVAGFIIPVGTPTSEMLVRGNPTLLDAAIAFVSGMVAAYATARKEIPAALAGVAIAAALMPPLCTVGLGIAFSDFQLALGSGLLFLTNILFIIVAEYGVFFLLGMRYVDRDRNEEQINEWTTRLWLAVIGLMILSVAGMLILLGRRALDEASIINYISEQIPGAQYVSLETSEEDGVLSIIYTARTLGDIAPERVDSTEAGLSDLLDQPVDLELATLQIVRSQSDVRRALIDYLETTDSDIRLQDYNVEETDAGLVVEAVWRSGNGINSEDVLAAEEALSVALDQPVTLSVVVQQVVSPAMVEASTATPTATAEAEAEATESSE
ncbi:MAG: hypothetical protein CL607_28050 [Anaerolineaceae bacterium]|nr:hypothetical protein [Anaerolineaceae bacterium]